MEKQESSIHLVDPELVAFLSSNPVPDASHETLKIWRTGMVELARLNTGPPNPKVACMEHFISRDGDASSLKLVSYQPVRAAGAVRPAYLHLHGGGFICGSTDMDASRDEHLADVMNCVVVSVDYRLAPETVFPGAIEDCYAALKWLHSHASELGVDRGRIIVGGESAGGGLAAALSLLARDRGEVPIAAQMLVYPMIDDRTGAHGASPPYVGEFLWTPASNCFGWEALLGRPPGGKNVSCYAAAARAIDLTGLPPTFMCVPSLDLFLDEDIDYARRLMKAGVPTELHVYPGAYHGFDMMVACALAEQLAEDFRSAFLKFARRNAS